MTLFSISKISCQNIRWDWWVFQNYFKTIFDEPIRSMDEKLQIWYKFWLQFDWLQFWLFLQLLGTVLWMWLEPPGIRKVYPQRHQVILKCRIEDSSLLFSQVFNVLLIIVCTVYAVKTRKIPENFNESKFIGFTMYTTCIIWLAFLPIYFGTANTNEVSSPLFLF